MNKTEKSRDLVKITFKRPEMPEREIYIDKLYEEFKKDFPDKEIHKCNIDSGTFYYDLSLYYLKLNIMRKRENEIKDQLSHLVVGGDTDSIFIKKPKRLSDKIKLWKIGKKAKKLMKKWKLLFSIKHIHLFDSEIKSNTIIPKSDDKITKPKNPPFYEENGVTVFDLKGHYSNISDVFNKTTEIGKKITKIFKETKEDKKMEEN